MSLTKLTENLNTHQSLPDSPALTSAQLKQKFDEAPNTIKQYINETLTQEIDETIIELESTTANNKSELQEEIEEKANTLTSNQLNLIYPVGSIYMSVNNSNPGNLFGGTWEQIKDRFLLAAGTSYNAGTTGGEASHKLTVAEIPSHTHGSKTLRGTFVARRYGSATPGTDIIGNEAGSGTSGIASRSVVTWSGTHQLVAGGPSVNKPSADQITINATHEHSSVGGNGSHNNMPPYLAVYVWKRTA